MNKSKFTEQQIAFALRQAETGTKVKTIIRQMGITEQTFYSWRESLVVWAPRSWRSFATSSKRSSRRGQDYRIFDSGCRLECA